MSFIDFLDFIVLINFCADVCSFVCCFICIFTEPSHPDFQTTLSSVWVDKIAKHEGVPPSLVKMQDVEKEPAWLSKTGKYSWITAAVSGEAYAEAASKMSATDTAYALWLSTHGAVAAAKSKAAAASRIFPSLKVSETFSRGQVSLAGFVADSAVTGGDVEFKNTRVRHTAHGVVAASSASACVHDLSAFSFS